jgi:hypothetical protein
MRNRSVTGFAVLAALFLATGCVAADKPAEAARSDASQSESRSATSPPAVPLRDQASKDKDKRGNTPPGMDRTGAGPAEGAILDPTGSVTRHPVLRER